MTFKSTPANFSSINDLLLWVVYDANAIDITKTDYKYVAEVWYDGVNVYTDRAYPRPDGAFGVFEFSEIIRSYVQPTFAPASGVVAQRYGLNEFRTKDVVIKFREEYNGSVGAVILTDSARQFYNHYNERTDGVTALTAYADKVASMRPKTIKLLFDTPFYFLPYYVTTTTPFTITIAGVTTTVTPSVAGEMIMFNIAPAGINAATPGTITSSTTDYDVVVGGVTYKVTICCKGIFTNYVAHFLNKLGGFESMLFNKPRRRSMTIERKTYKKPAYRIDGTGAVSFGSGSIMHEQRINYATKTNEKLRVQTDLLTDLEYQWLGQLVSSPFVYLEDAATLYPIVLTASDYNFNEYWLDRLTTLQVDVEFASSKNTQFR